MSRARGRAADRGNVTVGTITVGFRHDLGDCNGGLRDTRRSEGGAPTVRQTRYRTVQLPATEETGAVGIVDRLRWENESVRGR